MKKVFLMLIALISGVSCFAEDNGPVRTMQIIKAEKKTSFFLGVKGGVDLTTMTQTKETKLYDGMGVGYNAGIVVKARFNRASANAPAGTGILGAGLELKYKLNTVKTVGTNEDGKENSNLSLGYFEIPLYLQLFPFYKSDAMNTFYIEAGPDFAFLMSKSPKTLTVENPNPYASNVTYNIDNLKGGDCRILVGLGYDFPIKNHDNQISNLIGLNARYYIGTSNLAGNLPCKMNTVEISLSWMFNIGKL